MFNKKVMQRLWGPLNSTTSRVYLAFGTSVGVMEWSVGGTPLSATLLALRVDLKVIVALLVALLILGITAKSRNLEISGRSYGDAVNVSGWLAAIFIATAATMLGLAPVALLCYMRTNAPGALHSTIGALYVAGTMLMAWISITAVQKLAVEKYELYRRRRSAT